MEFILEFEQETDGRWIAEIPELPGVLAYGHLAENRLVSQKASHLATWRSIRLMPLKITWQWH